MKNHPAMPGESAAAFAIEVETASSLVLLHRLVEQGAQRLHVLHGERLHCARGCSGCCVDDLSVFAIEADEIKAHHRGLLRTGVPHALGGCAFLDSEGSCRIYAQRPYVCRTQGLPLRWLEETPERSMHEESLQVLPREHRDICPLNDAGVPIEALAEDACWTLGPAEEGLANLQIASNPASPRVSLRSLFTHPDPAQ
jgi:uncharacterized protein